MEKDQLPPKQQADQTPSSLLSQNPKEIAFADSSRNITSTNDRLKRDEWSEGAVSSLLEAYEAKWTLRNRAKLKGQDWEEVAKHVSARSNGSKSVKTQTQCKNKIESMKKRYRSESAAADASSWPLYPRLDLLLRGNGPAGGSGGGASNPQPVVIVEVPSAPPPPPSVAPPPVVLELGSMAQNSHGSNDGDRFAKEEGDGTNNNNGAKIPNQESEKHQIDDTDSSTPPIHFQKEKSNTKAPLKSYKEGRKDKSKRGREEYWDVGESIRWLAEVVVRSEQARMETMKEIERMRAEAEAKRGEMDLKRTEIIANTQLQIAKLFAKGSVDEWKKPT